ncbi:MAG TPA: DUF533 domain-containing protein [Thermoanaerobaculia bacterium]|nr:DUF533 domain-containing protein [Thermoanaerobaculia bacterium]
MDAEDILGSLIRGALGGRRKRKHGALRALTGHRGGSLINARTLVAAAGVAWGLYESAQRKSAMQGGGTGFASPPPPPSPPGGDVPPPPALPLSSSTPAGPEPPEDLLRLIRLTISAARADGTLTPEEEAAILEHARDVGLESVARAEISTPRPLAQIIAGFDPPAARDLYTLAFTIVRADEGVSGAERIYLAQLAHQLGLDPTEAAKLENDAASQIDEAATGA